MTGARAPMAAWEQSAARVIPWYQGRIPLAQMRHRPTALCCATAYHADMTLISAAEWIDRHFIDGEYRGVPGDRRGFDEPGAITFRIEADLAHRRQVVRPAGPRCMRRWCPFGRPLRLLWPLRAAFGGGVRATGSWPRRGHARWAR